MNLTGNRTLVDNGQSSWKIITGGNASPSEKHAGKELQHFIGRISGVDIPILDDTSKMGKNEIILGNNNRLAELGVCIDWSRLGDEGFIIKTVDDKLLIVGGGLRGTIYGVYTFLEEYLGCRWLSSEVDYIPKRNTIEIPDIDIEQIPVLEYREPYYYDAFDGDWAVRNKCNSSFARLEEKHGKKLKYSRYFVHTFDRLVPVSEYFDEHPEYFSEVNGKRISERTQLCLTNEDVYNLVLEKVREWIEMEPDATIFSISQNDWYNPCQCPKCKEIDDREGSHSGTLLHFVNRIAEEIEKDYPDKLIDTLAYQYTRKPPKYIRPRNNVIVRLCSIECCFSHPLEECDEICYRFADKVYKESSFAEDLKEWGKISDRLYVWDYVTNFHNYIMPFPNLYVLQPNIRFMIKNNVKGIFEEGNYAKGGRGEFAELRAYVLAKLLWNPDYNVDLAIDEFLVGYYGNAAAPIRQYIDLIHKKAADEKVHISIYDPPEKKYLLKEFSQNVERLFNIAKEQSDNQDILERIYRNLQDYEPPIDRYLPAGYLSEAEELFDRAERLAGDDEILERVRHARLPIEYVKLARMPKSHPCREELIENFFLKLKKAGITEIKEGRSLNEIKQLMLEVD
jgi:hypothetical protein